MQAAYAVMRICVSVCLSVCHVLTAVPAFVDMRLADALDVTVIRLL